MPNELKMKKISYEAFNELDYNRLIIQFELFLKKRVKNFKSINAYIKDIKQYIEWHNYEQINKSLIVNRKKLDSYKFYLKEVKKYEDSTVKRKLNTLVKLNEFLTNFNFENCNRIILDQNMCKYNQNTKCKRQYNYITKSFIKL